MYTHKNGKRARAFNDRERRRLNATAVLVGLVTAVGVAVWLYSADRQLNLLAPLVYGVLSGCGVFVVMLLWMSRRQSDNHRKDSDHE